MFSGLYYSCCTLCSFAISFRHVITPPKKVNVAVYEINAFFVDMASCKFVTKGLADFFLTDELLGSAKNGVVDKVTEDDLERRASLQGTMT